MRRVSLQRGLLQPLSRRPPSLFRSTARWQHNRTEEFLRRVESGSVNKREVINEVNLLHTEANNLSNIAGLLTKNTASSSSSRGTSFRSAFHIRQKGSLISTYTAIVGSLFWSYLLYKLLTSEEIEGPLSELSSNEVFDEYWPQSRIEALRQGDLEDQEEPNEDEYDDDMEEQTSWFDFFSNNPISRMWRERQAARERRNRLGRLKRLPSKGFEAVCGNDEPKEELQDVVDYLRQPERYQDMNLKMPKGILLSGKPGTGKTLMARSLAAEAGVPFLSCTGSSFEQVFVGVGSGRMRKLFERARSVAPCIVYIDEIDAVGGKRKSQNTARATLNQLLAEMDGFSKNSGIVLLASTNTPDLLDSALTRSGRFDRNVHVPLPDAKTRKDIFELYLAGRQGEDVDLEAIGKICMGTTGADIENVVNTAGIEALKQNLDKIPQRLLVEAFDIVKMGRPNIKMKNDSDEEEVLNTAYHEGAHAVAALYTEGAMTPRTLTILPRGNALGYLAWADSGKSETSVTRKEMLARVVVSLGGRVGETFLTGRDGLTSGSSGDLNSATSIVKDMVTKYGLSDVIGPVVTDDESVSPDEHDRIFNEIQRILTTSESFARDLLTERKEEHKALVKALLDKETLTLQDMKEAVNFKEEHIRRPPLEVLYSAAS